MVVAPVNSAAECAVMDTEVEETVLELHMTKFIHPIKVQDLADDKRRRRRTDDGFATRAGKVPHVKWPVGVFTCCRDAEQLLEVLGILPR
jgi:hypothetical protein